MQQTHRTQRTAQINNEEDKDSSDWKSGGPVVAKLFRMRLQLQLVDPVAIEQVETREMPELL